MTNLEIKAVLQREGEIEAIKRLRAATGMELREARSRVQAVAAGVGDGAPVEVKRPGIWPQLFAGVVAIAICVTFAKCNSGVNETIREVTAPADPAASRAGEKAGAQYAQLGGPVLSSDALSRIALSEGQASGYKGADRVAWESAFCSGYRAAKK